MSGWAGFWIGLGLMFGLDAMGNWIRNAFVAGVNAYFDRIKE